MEDSRRESDTPHGIQSAEESNVAEIKRTSWMYKLQGHAMVTYIYSPINFTKIALKDKMTGKNNQVHKKH